MTKVELVSFLVVKEFLGIANDVIKLMPFSPYLGTYDHGRGRGALFRSRTRCVDHAVRHHRRLDDRPRQSLQDLAYMEETKYRESQHANVAHSKLSLSNF